MNDLIQLGDIRQKQGDKRNAMNYYRRARRIANSLPAKQTMQRLKDRMKKNK